MRTDEDEESWVDRQVFPAPRGGFAALSVVAVVAGLILPVMAAVGQRPVGLWLVVLAPLVLLPAAG